MKHKLLIILILSLLLWTPIQAQDATPMGEATQELLPNPIPSEDSEITNPIVSIPEQPNEVYIMVILALALFLVKEVRSWRTETDILKTLEKIANSQNTLRAAEIRYENAGMQTQSFIKTIDSFAKGFERMAMSIAPNNPITKGIDLLEDITDEITDGEPVSPSEIETGNVNAD